MKMIFASSIVRQKKTWGFVKEISPSDYTSLGLAMRKKIQNDKNWGVERVFAVTKN